MAFEVWSISGDSLRAFLACSTQWRVQIAPAGLIWFGLDYPAVDIVLRRMGFRGDRVFSDLREMEAEALQAFSEVAS